LFTLNVDVLDAISAVITDNFLVFIQEILTAETGALNLCEFKEAHFSA